MLFSRRDWQEFVGSLKWFIGRGPRPALRPLDLLGEVRLLRRVLGRRGDRPHGALLWFPTFFTRCMPGWLLNVATIIHSDEALLAVGFIFTVHFFNTHFRPEKFPMDTVIFTGGIPLEEFKADRPREYQELVESGELEERLIPAPEAFCM